MKLIRKLVILAVVAVVLFGAGQFVLSVWEPTVSQTVGVEQALDTDAAHEQARGYLRVQQMVYVLPAAAVVGLALIVFYPKSKKGESK